MQATLGRPRFLVVTTSGASARFSGRAGTEPCQWQPKWVDQHAAIRDKDCSVLLPRRNGGRIRIMGGTAVSTKWCRVLSRKLRRLLRCGELGSKKYKRYHE